MNSEYTMLIVDDEPNVLKALKRLFLDTDYRVLSAQSGEEGLKKLEENEVSLVISDYRMPSMNGVEFFHQVKKLYPQTIRIILSGYADVAAVVEAINDGQIYKFIAKPWNDQELLTAIMRAFEQYDLQQENITLTQELRKRNEELESLAKSLEDKVVQRTRALELKNRALIMAQNILNLLPVGVLGIDADMTVVYINQALGNYVDISKIGLGLPLQYSPNEEIESILRQSMESGEVLSRIIDPSKKIGIICTPLPNKAGVVGTFSIAEKQETSDNLSMVFSE